MTRFERRRLYKIANDLAKCKETNEKFGDYVFLKITQYYAYREVLDLKESSYLQTYNWCWINDVECIDHLLIIIATILTMPKSLQR